MKKILSILSFILVTCININASAITLDFEDLTDSTSVTNQYAAFGLTFSNAISAQAGISLNEFELPPHSGSSVIMDDGGLITILFNAPVLSVSGFFTYVAPLTLNAFDASMITVANVSSAFSSNAATSGDGGSTPNEFLSLAFAGGISKLTIAGDPQGGSFALDDLTFTRAANVSEPSTIALILIIPVMLALRKKKSS